MENENAGDSVYTPALIAKERQLLDTLRALETMLETVQELRTKVDVSLTTVHSSTVNLNLTSPVSQCNFQNDFLLVMSCWCYFTNV